MLDGGEWHRSWRMNKGRLEAHLRILSMASSGDTRMGRGIYKIIMISV